MFLKDSFVLLCVYTNYTSSRQRPYTNFVCDCYCKNEYPISDCGRIVFLMQLGMNEVLMA